MRNIIIAVLIITALASLRADNVRLQREIRNLGGVVRDQALTLQYQTHPAVMQQRYFDWAMGQGEFKEPQR